MAIYPEYDEIPYLAPITISPRFKTIVSSIASGAEKRRAKFTYPLYDLAFKYDLLKLADARTLWQFYKDRKGSYESFYFILPYIERYVDEYVGVGDGVTMAFNIPGIEISAYTVKVGGNTKAETSEYTIDPTGGTDALAEINFGSAPPLGSYITISFDGRYAFKVRYAEDNLSFDVFYQVLTTMGIKLVGVR